jgi:hypothetical protein
MVSSNITFVPNVMKIRQLFHNYCSQFKVSVYPYTMNQVLEN